MKERLRTALNGNALSDEAYNIIESVLDELSDIDEEDVQESEVWELITEYINDIFTYFSDAWDYLQDQNITDFKAAIDNWGASGISQIAAYYLYEEISGAL